MGGHTLNGVQILGGHNHYFTTNSSKYWMGTCQCAPLAPTDLHLKLIISTSLTKEGFFVPDQIRQFLAIFEQRRRRVELSVDQSLKTIVVASTGISVTFFTSWPIVHIQVKLRLLKNSADILQVSPSCNFKQKTTVFCCPIWSDPPTSDPKKGRSGSTVSDQSLNYSD